jgi:hypothetical protein
MRAEDGAAGIGDAPDDVGEELAQFIRRRIPDRVRQIDRRAAGVDHRLDDAAQEIAIAARRVLRRKLHIVGERARELDGADRGGETLLACHPQLCAQVQI